MRNHCRHRRRKGRGGATNASPRQSSPRHVLFIEALEIRQLLSASFDVTGLTALRQDAQFSSIDGSGVGIAVLDTGVFAANPDLQSNVVAFYNAVEDPVNTALGSNPVAGAFDKEGHGSHVSGIAASSNPAIGVAYAADLIDIHVLPDSGEKQLGGDPLVRGLQWVGMHAQQFNIKVVNMSLGTSANLNSVTTQVSRTAIAGAIADLEALGIVVVSSSGNSYANYAEPGASFPAVVSTISVANTWADNGRAGDFGGAYGADGDRYYAVEESAAPDRIAATSQRSTLPNQVAAPGQDILSTWNGVRSSDNTGDPNHKLESGTSMASPFVSGTVALLQDAAKTFGGQYLSDPNQILQILQDTADTITDSNVSDNARYDSANGDLSNLPETGLTYKRVNVLRAVERVQQLVTQGNPTPTPTPTGGADTDSVTANATALPVLDATRTFTFQSAIGTDGTVQVGPNDVDLYKVDIEARGNFSIGLSLPSGGTPFGAALRIFDANGNPLNSATGYTTLNTDATSPLAVGIYYVGVSSNGNTAYHISDGSGATGGGSAGDYVLTVALQNPDPNGVAQGAVQEDLTSPNTVLTNADGTKFTAIKEGGLLGSDMPLVGSTTRTQVTADVDMFTFTAPDDGNVEVDTEAQSVYGRSGADTYIKVYDASLNLLGENDDKSRTNTDSLFNLTVQSGQQYYVAVTVYNNRGFDARDPYNSRTANSTPTDRAYDLYLTFDNGDADGNAYAAAPAAVGATIQGAIGTDAGQKVGADGTKDVDWASYTPAGDGLLDVAVAGQGNGFTPVISLWRLGDDGQTIVRVDDAGQQTPDHLIARVTGGQALYVAVAGMGNNNFNWYGDASGAGGQTGSYSLQSSLLPTSQLLTLRNDSIRDNTPTPLTLGATINADLGQDGDVVTGDGDVDLYAFTAPADLSVTFRTIASGESDADTVLRLFDASGTQIAANDNATDTGKESAITATVAAGQTYYVGVSGAGADALNYDPLTGTGAGVGSTGHYALTITGPAGTQLATFGGKTAAGYTDAAGHAVSLKLTGPGTGTLVTGPGPSDVSIVLTGTTNQTTLNVPTAGAVLGTVTADALKTIKGKNLVLGGPLTVTGNLASLSLASATAGGSITAGTLGSLKVSGDYAGALTLAGDFVAAKINGSITGATWNVAGTIRNLKVGGGIAGSTFRVGGDVTNLTANGALDHTTVRIAGGAGKVTIGAAAASTFYAGVADAVTALPAAAGDFAEPSSDIANFTVKTGPFSDTRIAAPFLGKIILRGVAADNAGTPYGLAAASLAMLNNVGVLQWHAGDDPALLVPEGDFVVRLLATA